jgi:DNA-binding transcriptional MerR regulator
VPPQPPDQRRWSIGELARASGATVRTLHHYDRIGLVRAAERTPSGHRRYTAADVRRLYRVRALAGLGLALDEIAAVLDGAVLAGPADEPAALRELLAAQLADLRAQADRIAERSARVQALLDRLDGPVLPDPQHLLEILEPLVLPGELAPGPRAAVAARAAEIGGARVEALKAETFDILAELRDLRAAGTAVDDPRVQLLARRWREIGAAFRTGDRDVDERVGAATGAVWRAGGAELGERLGRRLGWPDPAGVAEVVDYLQRAGQSR